MNGLARRKGLSAAILFGVAAGMAGLSFASVPLYRMFCQVTGFGGTPRTANVALPTRTAERQITVNFDANVNSALPWAFRPAQRQVKLRPGEEVLAHYVAVNTGTEAVTGTATFNVTPDVAARFFNKIDCFCFTEQTLAPGERVEMPVTFFIDPALLDDPDAREVTTVTLSYTFFRTAPTAGGPSAKAGAETAAAGRTAGGNG